LTDGEASEDDAPYSLLLSRAARDSLTQRLPEKIAAAAYEFVTGALLAAPHRVGGELGPPLAPARSARRGEYRVLYLIDEEQRTVKVTATRHRRDAYRS
jgi:mRNA-degrading endonuclease RelE of RelBE toxin-antitoxin system